MYPLIHAKLTTITRAGIGKFSAKIHAQDLMDGVSNVPRYVTAAELTHFFDLSQRAMVAHVNEPDFPEPRTLRRPRRYALLKVLDWWRRKHASTGYPEIGTATAIGLALEVWATNPYDSDRFEKLICDLLYERPLSLKRAAQILAQPHYSVRRAIRLGQLKAYSYFGANSTHRRGTLRIPLAESIIYSNRHLAAVRLPEAV